MLFASFRYILIFLPAAVLGVIAVRKLLGPRAAQVWVLAASVVFYTAGKPFNLVYLLISISVNWLVARSLERTEGAARKRILVGGLVLNVAYLCLFKYLGFFASIISFALPPGYRVPELGFPLGISFFTITQIMYLVDCYEDTLAAGSLFDHATFVAFIAYVMQVYFDFSGYSDMAIGSALMLGVEISRNLDPVARPAQTSP